MSRRSTSGPSPAASAARVLSSRPGGRVAACARISARSGPVSNSRSATAYFFAWTENFTSLKLVVTALSFGTYAPTW